MLTIQKDKDSLKFLCYWNAFSHYWNETEPLGYIEP